MRTSMKVNEEVKGSTNGCIYLTLIGLLALLCAALAAVVVMTLFKSDQVSLDLHKASMKHNDMINKLQMTIANETKSLKAQLTKLVADSERIDKEVKEQKVANSEKNKELDNKITQLISADDQSAVKLKQLEESDKEIEKKVVDAAKGSADADLKASATLMDVIAKTTQWKMSGDGKVLYKCFTEPKTDYAVANATCHGLGGRLAAKALRDATAVAYIMSSECKHNTWIGYFEVQNNWKWADGGATNTSTATWQNNEPNGNDPGDCGEIQGSRDGKIGFNDHPCSFTDRNRICEIDL